MRRCFLKLTLYRDTWLQQRCFHQSEASLCCEMPEMPLPKHATCVDRQRSCILAARIELVPRLASSTHVAEKQSSLQMRVQQPHRSSCAGRDSPSPDASSHAHLCARLPATIYLRVRKSAQMPLSTYS